MSNIKTVYYEGNLLLVHESVLDNMGLTPGQSITEAEMRECTKLNVSAFCADMAERRAAGENVPDTASLEAELAEQHLAAFSVDVGSISWRIKHIMGLCPSMPPQHIAHAAATALNCAYHRHKCPETREWVVRCARQVISVLGITGVMLEFRTD